MPANLQQIQFKLAEVEELRDDALATVRLLALGRLDADKDARAAFVSKFNGYEREFWALVKIERELIASGRISEAAAIRATIAPDAPDADSAVLTPLPPSDASEAVGERRRNEMRATPPGPPGLPAAGDAW
ncbi:MAG: hypothetical protein HS117_19345 [Verrucomicrobiaceae bacterium]|nr:hypothetical protein [Verrucomicrobiaceae bacterium]